MEISSGTDRWIHLNARPITEIAYDHKSSVSLPIHVRADNILLAELICLNNEIYLCLPFPSTNGDTKNQRIGSYAVGLVLIE